MSEGLPPPRRTAAANQGASPPWAYDIKNPACCEPLGLRLINVEHIFFTQSHINDSFSHDMRPVMEMVNEILTGAKKQREIPVVRVAWRDEAFWAIDNRRAFVFKHCKMGRVCVEVEDWAKHKEYDMKWRGGNEMRHISAGGQRVGLVQRLKDSAFPRSDVIELGMDKNDVSKLMDDEEQKQHDELLHAFSAKRQSIIAFEDMICTKVQEPWYFEATTSAGWMSATIWQAHIDGTFDAILLDGSVQTFRPRLLSEQLRLGHPQASASVLPEVQSDLHLLSMVVPRGVRSRLQIAWCAICDKNVGGEPRTLRLHERREHAERDRFLCSFCKKPFSCSDDLRKHSRSTQHAIPAAFGRYLGSSSCGEGNSDQEDEIVDGLQQRLQEEDVSSTAASSQATPIQLGMERAVFVVKAKGASLARDGASTQCALCQHRCSAKELVSHEEKQHTNEDFECQTCHKRFTCSKNLRKHSRSTSHQILCAFMLDEESKELESSRSATSGSHAPLDRGDLEVSSPPVENPAELGIRSITMWWNAQLGIRLMERIGSTTGECSSEFAPSWADLVLEKWCGDGERCYLYCPANQLWFWEDEAETRGWCQELLHKGGQ